MLSILVVILYAIKYLVRKNHRYKYTIGQKLFFVFDRVMVMTLNIIAIRSAFCELYRLMINSYVYSALFEKLDKQFTAANRMSSAGHANEMMRRKVIIHHYGMTKFIAHLNKHLVSIEMAAFICTQIPYNIYLFTKVALGTSSDIMVLSIAIFQMSLLLLAAVPITQLSKSIHCISNRFVIAQFHVKDINEKMKLLNFYEKVHTINPIGFNFGTLGTVTTYTVFQVYILLLFNSFYYILYIFFQFVLVYIVYIMFSTKIILKVPS